MASSGGSPVAAEIHLRVPPEWRTRFERRVADERPERLTVRLLHRWIDEPQPTGLPPWLKDLVILAFAAETNRPFTLYGHLEELLVAPPPPPNPDDPKPPQPPPKRPKVVELDRGSSQALLGQDALARLEALTALVQDGARLDLSWSAWKEGE